MIKLEHWMVRKSKHSKILGTKGVKNTKESECIQPKSITLSFLALLVRNNLETSDVPC